MRRLIALIFLLLGLSASAQDLSQIFGVKSFSKLDWDLEARSTAPVLDQNGHKTALIKVVTSETDLDFDVGMMGIVEKKQEVGEVWLYVPEHVMRITIRHKDYGVIRSYEFPLPIEAATVYELVIDTPSTQKVVRDTVMLQIPVTQEIAVSTSHGPEKTVSPKFIAQLTVGTAPDYGTMISYMRRFGGFVRASSNFRKAMQAEYECSSDGTTSYGKIWTTGETRLCHFSATAGFTYSVTDWLAPYAGLGYGQHLVYWEDIGGDWEYVTDISSKGLAADAGIIFTYKHYSASVGVSTIGFRYIGAEFGLGIRF